MRNRRDKCINTPERQHLNQRILIRKRFGHCGEVDRLLRRRCQYNRRRRKHQTVTAAAFCQRIEDNAFHLLSQSIFCGVRARLISKRIRK